MSEAKFTVRVSAGGRITLPKAIRERRGWRAGTNLVVEEVPGGVALREASDASRTDPASVFGMLKYRGAPVSTEDMDAGILAEARRRFERSGKT